MQKQNSRTWLKLCRKNAGLTQLDMAKHCNITRSYYSQIELGMKTPNVRIAKSMGEKLKFDWTVLYEKEPLKILEKLIAN